MSGAALGLMIVLSACGAVSDEPSSTDRVADRAGPVASRPTRARSADGRYISWREHIIDDPATSGVPLSGSDGLVMADLDLDGRPDVVSVHESDTTYRRRSGRVPGIAPRHPPTPPDIRFSVSGG